MLAVLDDKYAHIQFNYGMLDGTYFRQTPSAALSLCTLKISHGLYVFHILLQHMQHFTPFVGYVLFCWFAAGQIEFSVCSCMQ